MANESWSLPLQGNKGILEASSGQLLSMSEEDGKDYLVNLETADQGLKRLF